jgi:glycosyl hydrolase family 127 (putative beta-L-arabinofuranosidase)/beta-L-arabinofuranosidase (glycosyl hydrolase family 127)
MQPPFATQLTRRQVMKAVGTCGIGIGVSGLLPSAASLPALDVKAASPVVKDKQPLLSSAFFPLPLGSIHPRGWLLEQLRIQASGLSGHLGEVWPDAGPNSGWLGGSGESWERGPYYLDGLLPLAYQLDDQRLKTIAQKFVDWTLEHGWPNGMIGPAKNDDWWPRIVMLKALSQYQELTGDPRVIPMMDKYFQYQLGELPKRPLRDWGKFRWQDEVLSVVWLYNRTGSSYLLDLARMLHKQGYDWIGEFADFQYRQKITAEFIKLEEGQGLADLALATHGVNNGQAVKTGPVWSQVSASAQDRDAVFQMIEQLNRYHGLPNGMFSCDEHLAGRDPSQGSELCTVVEYMFSLERSVAITGSVALADRLELLAYNALPGTLSDDMWAHQYNQEPNQVECSLHHKPWVTDGPESNLFGLEPNFGCCTANYHQGWPKFTNSLWMSCGSQQHDREDGLATVAYGPCEVRTQIRGVPVHVIEETDYPFRGKVRLTVTPDSALAFPLQLRIPEWAKGATVRVNGEPIVNADPGTFKRVDRTWRAGDRVEIDFPMQLRTSKWFNESIAIERGPLIFSYGIGEDWVKLRDNGLGSADWQIFPTTPWNYALKVNTSAPEDEITVTEAEVGQAPFSRAHAPVRLEAKVRKIPLWRAEDGAANPLPESPVSSQEKEETVTLIPYAAAKLRVTAFAQLKP